MTGSKYMMLGGALLLAWASPRAAAADCVPAELAELLEGDFEICPEADACPCFSAEDIDDAFTGLNDYMYTWGRRAGGIEDQTSLRADSWVCTADGWSAPTVGFDTYIETAACGTIQTYTCEVWDDRWLAAPYHRWAGKGMSVVTEITETEFAACEAVLLDWAADDGTPTRSW